MPPLAAKVITVVGRGLVGFGLLILAFAAFQLWGTNVTEARAQDDLTERFRDQLQTAQGDRDTGLNAAAGSDGARAVGQVAAKPGVGGAVTHTDPEYFDPTMNGELPDDANLIGAEPGGDEVTLERQTLVVEVPENGATATGTSADDPPPNRLPQPAPAARPEIGDPIGILNIPAIDVTKTVAEGTSREVLRAGPGHYHSTPLPGESGNVAIAGHRTTHGAPFLDIDQLQPGDEITFETIDGTFVYEVEGHPDANGHLLGHRIVRPDEVGVIADHGDNRLTLTACHPKYSAQERIIVTAVLVSAPEITAPLPVAAAAVAEPTPSEPSPSDQAEQLIGEDVAAPANDGRTAESLGWQPQYLRTTVLWGLVTALVAAAGALVARRWRRVPAYAATTPLFLMALFTCFVNLEKLLPAI